MLSCYNDGTRDRYQSLVNFDARCTCCSAAVLYTLKEHYVYGANQTNFVLVVAVVALSLCQGFAPVDWDLYTTYFSI